MLKVAIIGGETHIGEITALAGTALQIVGACVRPDQREWAQVTLGATVFDAVDRLLDETAPDLVAVANENDLKASAVLTALRAGCDVVVDKPLAITANEQAQIESFLHTHPERRLLMLLTLRGNGEYSALREMVRSGEIGTTAFVEVRMAVQLKRAQRPPWFLDVNRSGGLFLDLLIHGLDQVEWITGQQITALTGVTGNLGVPGDENLRDHAAVFCELSGGGSAIVEGQRMLPGTVGSDYRVTVAGTEGFADLRLGQGHRLIAGRSRRSAGERARSPVRGCRWASRSRRRDVSRAPVRIAASQPSCHSRHSVGIRAQAYCSRSVSR